MNNWKSKIDTLVCPVSKEKLEILDEKTVTIINKKIESNQLTNNLNNVISSTLTSAIKVNNKNLYYPVIANIPYLSEDESFTL